MMRIRNSNQNAAVRLAKLPVVRSAYAFVSVLYLDTKGSNPCIRSLCEVVESRVMALTAAACDRAAPVLIQLEPQITIFNDLACKSLDRLESAFPLLHQPPEEIAACAKTMMLEAKDMVSVAATGTMDCVLYTVTWVAERMQAEEDPTGIRAGDQSPCSSPLKRAIGLASEGLDSALNVSEALVDQVLSPTNAEMEEEVKAVEGFEVNTAGSSYSVRLVSLTAKLCRRAYHHAGVRMQSVKINNLNSSTAHVQLYTALIYLVLNTTNWLLEPFLYHEPSVLVLPPPQAASSGHRRKRPVKKPIGCRAKLSIDVD